VKLFLMVRRPLNPLVSVELNVFISSLPRMAEPVGLCLTPPQLCGRLSFFSFMFGFIICYFSLAPFNTLLSLRGCVNTGGY